MSEAIINKIKQLKEKHNAVILAHNYVAPELQDIADVLGDSLQLSIEASKLGAPVIVFCGVSFMAETAKILSPESKVLLPVRSAGCPMADMATAEAVAEFRRTHPEHVLVAYVNSTAAVKAEVDICCTSANAEKIVASIPADKKIMFLPDRNLGRNVAKTLNREMDFWPGYCPIHNAITVQDVEAIKNENPGMEFLVHPECTPEVVALADRAMSTGGMLKYIRESDKNGFIVGTECGIMDRLQIENPTKTLIPFKPTPTCVDMKKIGLADVLACLESLEDNAQSVANPFEVVLDEELMDKARKPIERMLAFK